MNTIKWGYLKPEKQDFYSSSLFLEVMASCELCGREGDLLKTELEGVELSLCSSCSKFGKVKRYNETSFRVKPRYVQPEEPELKVVENYFELIRNAREKRNLNQEDFAKLLQERESQISKWELGHFKPSVETAEKMGRILGMNLVMKEENSAVKIDVEKNPGELTLGDIKIKTRVRVK